MREELLDDTPLQIMDRSGIVYEDPDLEQLDKILADVSRRNSVYTREIFEQLPDNAYSALVIEQLKPFVAKIDGTELLHSRDFMNPLLDYRLYLTQEAVKESEVKELADA